MIPGQGTLVESVTKKFRLGLRYFEEHTGKTWYYVKANEALIKGAIVTAMFSELDGDCDVSSGKELNDAVGTFTAAMVDSFVKINADTANIDQAPNRIAAFVDADQVLMEDAWGSALTTDEDYVVYNPWKVEECDAAGEQIVGVSSEIAITSGYYFWMQTGGYANHIAVKGDGNALVAGRAIIASGTTGRGFGPTAVPSGDTYNTVAMELARVQTEQARIVAAVPTALAAQTIPGYLSIMP